MDELYEHCLGRLKLLPRDVEDLTPGDVADLVRGWNVRRKILEEDQAWMVGQIIGVQPARLLKREQTEEEAMAVVKAFSAIMGG